MRNQELDQTDGGTVESDSDGGEASGEVENRGFPKNKMLQMKCPIFKIGLQDDVVDFYWIFEFFFSLSLVFLCIYRLSL